MQRKQTKIYHLFSKVKFCNRTLFSGRMPWQMHQQVFSVFQLHLLKVLKVLGHVSHFFIFWHAIKSVFFVCFATGVSTVEVGRRVFLMVISDVLLMYLGEDRGIRSAVVFFCKPIFAMFLTDAVSQSLFGCLCIRGISLYLMSSVELV